MMSDFIKKRIKSKYNREDRNAFLFCYLLLLVPVVQFIVFWVAVNFNSIILAFEDDAGNFTLHNFVDVYNGFIDEDMYGWNTSKILLRTIILWFSVNIICTPLIMFSTYVLFKKIFMHHTFRTIFVIPTVVGAIIWTTLMRYFVSADGPILTFLLKIGANVSDEVLQNGLLGTTKTAFITIMLIDIIPNLVACNLIITGAFQRIPQEIFESGKLDGVNFIQEFINIALPCAWPTIVINLIGSLATIFTANGNVFLYTMGQFETGTMGFYLYYMVYRISNSIVGTNAFGYPAAVGITLTCMTLPVILVSKHFLEKAYTEVEF